jgi:hypothetical protein
MPTVPRLSGPSVEQTIRPSAGFTVQASTAGADAIAAGANKIADAFNAVYVKEKEKADQAAIFDARRRLSEWERGWFDPENENGVFAHRGKNARALPDVLHPDFDRVRSEIAASLDNDDQRAAFDNIAFQFGDQLNGRVNSFVMQENEKYVVETEAASLASLQEEAAVAAREGRFDAMANATQLALDQIRLTNTRKGLDEVTTQNEIAAFTSSTIVSATNGMLESGNYQGAVEYYKANAEDMVESDRARMDNTIRTADLLVRETSEANAIMARYGTGSAAVRAAEQISDPVLRDRVVSNIDREAARQERARNEGERAMTEGFYAKGFGIDPAKPMTEVFSPAEIAAMPPSTFLAIQGMRDRMLDRTATQTDPREFERLVTMPDNKFAEVNLTGLYADGKLSVQHLESLKARQEAIRNPDPSKQPRSMTEAEILGRTFTELGIPPSGGKPADVARRGSIRLQYQDLEAAEVKAKGRELTQDEQQAIVQRLTLKVARETPVLFGWTTRTEERRVYEVEVPPAARQRIIGDITAEALRRGVPTPPLTEDAIREAYFRNESLYGTDE